MQKNILVVDDDSHIQEVVKFALEKAGMNVSLANDGCEAIKRFRLSRPSLIVLDISMPEMDGLEVCKEIRKTSDVPILFLSSKDEEIDKIVGLEIGGDDYLTKPFSPRELVARINSILKRVQGAENTKTKILSKGKLSLEKEKHLATFGSSILTLTSIEFQLVHTMLSHPEKVYSRDELMDGSHGNIVVSDRTIDSHVRNLRNKFAEVGANDVISTVHGIGYRLGSCQ